MSLKLDYLEYPANDLDATKAFFAKVFNWQFTDYGADYCAFADGTLNGGFYRSELTSRADKGAALCVFYASDLTAVEASIVDAGGSISTPTFEFPGGRRFHFLEPSGNEFAVWSD